MAPTPSSITQIRKIDNSRQWLPLATTFIIIFIILILIWFFRGGSFRLYASVFFSLYALTGQIWVSVLLVGILQSLAFLPLRFIGLKFSTSLEQFEDLLEKTKNESEQYFLFSEKVKKGDWTVIFFIFNFIINAIAFLSAGRIFLIDFYTQKLDPSFLYSFIPYPKYPLQGTLFNFPFFKITDTMALSWHQIINFWLIVLAVMVIPRLLWRLIRIIFQRNKKILAMRINYNRFLLYIAGGAGTFFFLSLYFMRHIPTAVQGIYLIADLTRQNTTMNTITAIGTFITVLHAGYTRQRIASQKAKLAGINSQTIHQVSRENMRQTFRNALFLGLGAFFVTNQIPCAFELSVATFEIIYMLSPLTFDKLLIGMNNRAQTIPSPSPATPTAIT